MLIGCRTSLSWIITTPQVEEFNYGCRTSLSSQFFNSFNIGRHADRRKVGPTAIVVQRRWPRLQELNNFGCRTSLSSISTTANVGRIGSAFLYSWKMKVLAGLWNIASLVVQLFQPWQSCWSKKGWSYSQSAQRQMLKIWTMAVGPAFFPQLFNS